MQPRRALAIAEPDTPGRSRTTTLAALIAVHLGLHCTKETLSAIGAAVGEGGDVALACADRRRCHPSVSILVLVGWLNLKPLMQHPGFAHDARTRIESQFIHNQALSSLRGAAHH